jgi:hypothetical protein
MSNLQFKYHINHYLSLLPVSIEEFSKSLEKEFHIPPQLFHRDRLILEGNPLDIPFSRLRIYAFLLGTSVDLLIQKNTLTEK